MGKEEDVVEAVLTCRGDFHDPELQSQIERFRHKLKDLLLTDSQKLLVKKVEPWNSVKVTVSIPREAAERLRQLAQNGSEALQQLGVYSVQLQGDSQIALTFLGSNNEHREVILNSSPAPQIPPSSSTGDALQQQLSNPPPTEAAVSLDNLASSPGPSSDEVTRKNIVDYLRQGPHLRQNAALIGSLMGAVGAVSPSPRLGMGQDIPTVSNSVTNNIGLKAHSYRPNNITNVGVAAAHLQGSQVAKNFPFKTTGAFQPPVPRPHFSEGQSMVGIDSALPTASSTQLKQQTNSINPSAMQPTPVHQISALPGGNQHGVVSGLNNFNQPGHPVRPSGLNNSNFTSSIAVSPSSSSSSNYFVDLPPPPPYPHGSSSVASPRANKPGNASSPMLVNLLQTDPSFAAAGMASGNPNKPLAMGEQSNLDSSPKKKRKRKLKPTPPKPSSHELASSQANFQPSSVVHPTVDSNSNPVSLAQTVTTADTHKPFTTILDASATLTSFGGNKSSVSVAQSYPLKDSQRGGLSSSKIPSDFNKSAIAARTNHSLFEPNRQLSQQQADVFSPEMAVGKIINPYTGQLEPRDSIVDSSLLGLKDPGLTQKSAYSATQILARKAIELEDIAQKRVPQSSSALLENVHAAQHVSSSTLNLVSITSKTTAAASSMNSSETTLSIKRSLTQPDIQTNSSLLCPSTQNSTSITSSADSQLMQSKDSCSLEAISKTVGHGLSNGPLTSDSVKSQMRPTSSEGSLLHATGVSSSSSDSVIYSNLRVGSYSSNVHAPLMHQIDDQRNQVKTSPFSASHSSLSLSVSLDIPSAQTRLSSPMTTAEQSKPVIDHASFTHHRQAAKPNRDIKLSSSTLATSPSLLNSVPEKHLDSVSSTESPPEAKILLEGDENSDHTGLVTDSGPEQSAAAALIEHSRVKIENHDSGVGSSSERSDDTPSEPGDGEFRTGHPASEAEESTTKGSLSHKLVDCKTDSPLVTVSSSITVGYMINPSIDSGGKLSSNRGVVKKSVVEPISSVESSGSNISQFYDAHCKSMEKQAGLMAVEQVSLTSKWLSEKAGAGHHSQHGSKVKENGPMTSNVMENRTSPKLNGPTPQGSFNSMMAAMSELHAKKIKLSPKSGGINSKDLLKEEHQVKEAVIDKLNRINHHLEDQKESSLSPSGLHEMKGVEVIDKSQSELSLPNRLEGHSEQLYLDLEEMQMKMMGNGTAVVAAGGNSAEGKGANITSIYSKRSSPVNVNMLNHIYASGLPLPRRLTESVQRLVKPLPASEMGMSLSVPQSRAYNSKSPVSSSVGALSKAGPAILSSTGGPHLPARMANHSGARSPGASIPRLIPNDQHRLLSGGLDLAGLSGLQIPLASGADSVSVRGTSGVIGHMPTLSSLNMREDLVAQGDPLSSINFQSSPTLLRDSQAFSNRMLSQSYPPFKAKDHLANVVQRNHDIQINLNSSNSNEVVHHSLIDSKLDSLTDIPEKGNLQYPVYNKHSHVEKKESRLSNQYVADETHTNHSNKRTDGSDSHRFAFSSSSSSSASTIVHSNASSPLMPILQRGQEPPLTPTLPSNMPSISSQPPLISLATTEISPHHEEAAGKPTLPAIINQSQLVPCSKPSGTSSLTTRICLENPKDSTEISAAPTPASKLPILSPVVSSNPSPLLDRQIDPSQIQARSSAQSSQDQGASDPPKLTKAQAVTSDTSVSLKTTTHSYQLNRNIFDTVSAESLPVHRTATTLSSLGPKTASMEYQRKFDSNDDQTNTCDSSPPLQSILGDAVNLDNNQSVDKSVESCNKTLPENGSKQHSSVTQQSPVSDNSKFVKLQLLTSTPTSKTTTISNSEKIISKTQERNTLPGVKTVPTSAIPYSSSWSAPVSVPATVTPVKGNSSSLDIPMPNSSSTVGMTKPQLPIVACSSSHNISANSTSTITTVVGNGDTCPSQSVTGGEPSISSSPVKEPILETLASALKQNEPSSQGSLNISGHHSKTSEKGSASATQKPPIIPLTASDISKLEQNMTLQGKMVAVQSSTQIKVPVTEQLSSTSSELTDPGSSHSRVTRKRKINPSEAEWHDIDGSTSIKATTLKHANLGCNSKKLSEDTVNRTEKTNAKDAGPVEIGVIHTKAVFNSTERSEIKKASLEHKESAAKISADLEKSQERRRHRSMTSSSQSDDGHSHCSSSNESRDSTSPSHKDGRSNRTALSNADKDGRTYRSSGSTPAITQQRETKLHHRSYPGSDKDAQSKENRSHRVPGHHSSEDARHTQVDWSEDHSGDDKDKMKLSGGKQITSGEKFPSADGKDDSQKKGQRVKRQFYAYVPEKSLDQKKKKRYSPPWSAYFDTPILSGRTRSKNKPSEEETTAGTGSATTPSTGDSHVSSIGTHNATSSTVTATGQSVGHSKHAGDHGATAASDATGTGGKRSTRSVRTKDTSQEQNPNKRRKVQQQR
ncbi:nuclear receptor coactivator 6 [Elysia marginata]|uniref:Nuclear receptor coactivator 6 n=1 Tax=Elysia marginata TaxID=1093978 RepID=A0AAV4HVA0_9GAST|nr:nuclear receptor coactivator 6 [Elysia marginata]